MSDVQPTPPIEKPFEPTPLWQHLILGQGMDPMWAGATGYGDNVFPLRLYGDTE